MTRPHWHHIAPTVCGLLISAVIIATHCIAVILAVRAGWI